MTAPCPLRPDPLRPEQLRPTGPARSRPEGNDSHVHEGCEEERGQGRQEVHEGEASQGSQGRQGRQGCREDAEVREALRPTSWCGARWRAPAAAAQHVGDPDVLPHQRDPDLLRRPDRVQPARPGPLGAQLLVHHLLRLLGRRSSAGVHPAGDKPYVGVRAAARRSTTTCCATPRCAHTSPRTCTTAATARRSRWCSSTRRPRRSATSSDYDLILPLGRAAPSISTPRSSPPSSATRPARRACPTC